MAWDLNWDSLIHCFKKRQPCQARSEQLQAQLSVLDEPNLPNSFQDNGESDIEEVNVASMVDLDDNEDIDTELWTNGLCNSADYISLSLPFTLKLCFPSYSISLFLMLLQFKWNRRLPSLIPLKNRPKFNWRDGFLLDHLRCIILRIINVQIWWEILGYEDQLEL